ncbi:Predicted TonB-dependent receptor [Desulfosarcina cetonica]|uniref:TonB-dependent receptor n=1 Tax=Desulfosarcina cetonica TaxID=90730 RepID=UPI000A9534B1|nr:TonB-dependent receptor [Desulfosarcina cetonica]VTR67165.1 Predicted TonB-dependent receptor [Desulfosarcina cetonica]
MKIKGSGGRNVLGGLAVMIGLLMCPLPVLADEDGLQTHVLDEIVVTSTSKTKMIDTPASISVITAADLEQMGAKNIIEALERIPGVYNTSASSTSLSIRGTRSSMAGGPVILVDGVPQKYGNNRREELDLIPVSQIARIEVLRSAGIAYGPGSARGVINIITKKGQADKPLNVRLSGSYGSWSTSNVSGSLDGRLNQWDYYADLSYFETDGYEEEDESRTAGLLKLGYNLSALTRIGVSANWVDYDRDSAYDLYKYQWQLDNYRRNIHFPRAVDDDDLVWNNRTEQESAIYTLNFSHKGNPLFVDGTLSYTCYDERYYDTKDIYYSSSRSRGDEDHREQDTYTATLSAGYAMNFGAIGYTPTIGVNYEAVDFSQRRTYPYDTAGTVSTAAYDLDLEETNIGVFWDNDLMFGDHWGLKIGVRIDQVDLTLENKVPEQVDADDTKWSWSVAPAYHFTPNANLYFSVSRNYWFPSPQYYFWASNYGSPNNRPEDLKPEEATTFELGYKHRVNRGLNMTLTVYLTETKDKFGSYYEGGSYYGQKNTGDAETYGVELELDGRPLDWLGYRLSGAYINAEWKKGTARVYEHPSNTRVLADLDGYQVNGIPEFNGRVGLDFYPFDGFRASVDANIWGEYYLDYLNSLTYPSKTTFDASISYTWSRYKVWILGKNIFDEKMERAINTDGELTEPGGEPLTAYYVLDGAYVEAGVSIKF